MNHEVTPTKTRRATSDEKPSLDMLMQIYCCMVWLCNSLNVTGYTQRKRVNRFRAINEEMLIGYLKQFRA